MSELQYPQTHLVWEQGRPEGCLPRKTTFGEKCSIAAEHIKLIPRSDWAALAAEIKAQNSGLRQYVKTVLDQDGRGSCATESTTQAVMVARAFQGLKHVELNPWSIYWKTSGGRDQGSSIDENLAYARDVGICPMSLWPRSKGWNTKPSDEALEAAKQFRIEEFYDVSSIDECVSCLLQGFPVVYGANGHSVLKIEHLNDREGLDVNSWGAGWGDGGFGVWARYAAINFGYGMFAIRTASEVK